MPNLSLLVLLILSLFNEDFLILRNGKKIPMERYEKHGSQIRVFANGEVFALPERIIDWDATTAEKERLKASAIAEAERQKAKKIAEEKAAEKKKVLDLWNERLRPDYSPQGVVLTAREYEQMTGNARGPFHISLRKNGNSLIVSALINKQGPFDLVLDTGAQVTVLDPRVAEEIGARDTGKVTQIVGVGSRVMQASIAEVDQIALGQAKVKDLPITLKSIPALKQYGVVGLLGQDFLNHFVVNLDAANNRLTLTRTGSSSEFESSQSLVRDLPNPIATYTQLNQVESAMRALYIVYHQMQPQKQPPNHLIQRIKKVNRRLQKLRHEVDRIYSFINEIPEKRFSSGELAKRNAFMKCRAHYMAYLAELQKMGQELSRAYSHLSSERSIMLARDRLDLGAQRLLDKGRKLNSCM